MKTMLSLFSLSEGGIGLMTNGLVISADEVKVSDFFITFYFNGAMTATAQLSSVDFQMYGLRVKA